MADVDKLQLYFLALVPPEPIFKIVQNLKNELLEIYGLKAALNSPPHITLQMPFRYPIKKESHLIAKLNEVYSDEKLKIRQEGFGAFPPKVLFINVAADSGLSSLQHTITQTMRKRLHILNTNYKDQVFHPHMTIAFRDLKKKIFPEVWQNYSERRIELEWTTSTFCLMKHNGDFWNIGEEFQFLEQYSES